MVVGVSGHGRRRPDADARGAARRHGAERQTGAPAPAAARPRRRGRTSRVHHKDADQAHLILGVPSYPIEHPDRYALQLLSAVLGSGMSSRLFLEVRERRGLAYYVHGINHSYTDAGSLLAQAGVDIKRIDEAIKVDRRAVRADGRRGGRRRGAREVARARQGPLRPAHREPAGADHVRAEPRGARGRHARARASCSRRSTPSPPTTCSGSPRT